MAMNKLALIRYKTIDVCLCNRRRKWTLEDLIEKVSDVLYEQEGITSGVSKRTIQADIQVMRSDKLGYNAPIIVTDKKYYAYEEADFTITRAPINPADIDKMNEVVGFLKQFSGFAYFADMNDLIARLEDNLHRSQHEGEQYIQLENNHLVKGLEYITPLYQAITQKKSLLITYKSFKAASSQQNICYPYLLKEYRNRWFLIAKGKKGSLLVTMALDRILALEPLTQEPYQPYTGVPLDVYFDDVLGITKTEKDKAQRVVLFIKYFHAPYVLTKPIHHSQKLLKQDKEGIIIQLEVVVNRELERELLGFGEYLKVLSPASVANRIHKRLIMANEVYIKQA